MTTGKFTQISLLVLFCLGELACIERPVFALETGSSSRITTEEFPYSNLQDTLTKPLGLLLTSYNFLYGPWLNSSGFGRHKGSRALQASQIILEETSLGFQDRVNHTSLLSGYSFLPVALPSIDDRPLLALAPPNLDLAITFGPAPTSPPQSASVDPTQATSEATETEEASEIGTIVFSSLIDGQNRGGQGAIAFPASVWDTPIHLSASLTQTLGTETPPTESPLPAPSSAKAAAKSTQLFSFTGTHGSHFQIQSLDHTYSDCGVTVAPEGGNVWACDPSGHLF
jgi:hypothetical protein